MGSDEALREALRPLAKEQFDVPSGWVRIWQPEVQEAGLDVEAVEEFIVRSGGRPVPPELHVSQQVGGGGWPRHKRSPPSYVVPRTALWPDDSQ